VGHFFSTFTASFPFCASPFSMDGHDRDRESARGSVHVRVLDLGFPDLGIGFGWKWFWREDDSAD
jgi:hypothetical protein